MGALFGLADGGYHGRGMRHRPGLDGAATCEVVSPARAREYQNFLKGAQTSMMSDPESLRLARCPRLSNYRRNY
jgi:hypothetical protein